MKPPRSGPEDPSSRRLRPDEGLSRRRFLKAAGMASAALALARPDAAGALASPALPLYLGASYLPPSYKGLAFGVAGFMERLQRAAREVMRVELFDAATLMKADEQLAGLRKGTIHFMFHTTTYLTEELPILGIIGLPRVAERLYEHGERMAMGSPLWKLLNGELSKANLFLLTMGAGTMEPEFIWSHKAKIASVSDLSGKRCRVVGSGATEILSSFGAFPVRVPSEQVQLALQRGALDAVVSSIDTVVGRNLHEHLRWCFALPVTAAASAVFLLRESWEKMTSREKAAFWDAGLWYDENQSRIGYRRIAQEEMWPLARKAGIELVQPTAADSEAFAQRARPVWTAWQSRLGDEVGRRAIELAVGSR